MNFDDLLSWANNPTAIVVVPALFLLFGVVFGLIRREWRRFRKGQWKLF